jgi:hypothetical protein
MRHIVENVQTLLEVIAVSNSTVGVQDYAIPTDMFALHSIRYKGIHLKGYTLKEFDEFIDGWDDPTLSGGTGTPVCFTVYAGMIKFFPIPDASVTGGIKIYYTRTPVDVTNVDATIPELPIRYHEAILDYCLQQAHEKNADWDAAGRKQQSVRDSMDGLGGLEDANNSGQETFRTITVLVEDW